MQPSDVRFRTKMLYWVVLGHAMPLESLAWADERIE